MGGDPDSKLRFTAAADWSARRGDAAHKALVGLDRATGTLETPVVGASRPSGLNPLNHTGPIGIFLFVVAFATGVYVTMFYRFGFEASYTAVELVEESFVGRFMRASHRYSSIALVVVALLHGWRTFATGRFQKPRRTAWVTGIVMVAIVWLIGVTGYWLIWDERAQVLNEALRRVMASFSAGLDFMLDNVLTRAAGTGWPFLLLVFLVHFFLSLGVAVLLWYHLRHLARPTWLPSARWVALVGGSLVFASMAFPLGMLPPLDRTGLVGGLNVDPFFLFLLPLAVSWSPGLLWGGAAAATALAIAVPWLIRRRRPGPVEVIADRCIGCTWCAIDCPYDAISMIDTPDGAHLHVAVVEPDKCVSCGICLGSCPTKALALNGREPAAMWEELEELAAAGDAKVAITCQRHAEIRPPAAAPTLVLPCVGMAGPSLLEAATDFGLDVELIGCPEDDCSYREGSLQARERLAGTRPPRLRKAYRKAPISVTTAPPGRIHPRPPAAPKMTFRSLAPLVGLIAVVGLGSIWLSQATYDVGESEGAAITVTLDHRAGLPLVGDLADEAIATGAAPRVTVTIDGEARFDEVLSLTSADSPDTALLWERFLVAPGTHDLTVELADDPDRPARVLFDDIVAMEAGESLLLDYRDQAVVVAADAGESIFNNTTQGVRSGCAICHSLQPGVVLVGPSLAGVASRAGSTVPGLTAAEYLHESIVSPDKFVVPGYPAGQMLADLDQILTEQEIDELVAFLLTLEDG